MAKIAEKLWEWTIYINKPKCQKKKNFSNEQKIKTN